MSGRLEVITGSMFSGKTEKLLSEVLSNVWGDTTGIVLYPNRYMRGSHRDIEWIFGEINWRNLGKNVDIRGVNSLEEYSPYLDDVDTIFIDEGQFFELEEARVVRSWRRQGKNIWVSGLDMDYQEDTFEIMTELCGLADKVTKLHTKCMLCRVNDAYISHRLSNDIGKLVVGDQSYEALCIDCYNAI